MTDNLDRLMARVEYDTNGGCWLWSGPDDGHGYGPFWLNGRVTKAHRAAWTLVHGPIPKGLVVMHRCDVPACVNPSHLTLGTQAQNLADMRAKGRASETPREAGERCGASKLTSAEALRIREDYAAGIANQYELASRHGVTQYAIWSLLSGRTWKHVGGPRLAKRSPPSNSTGD